MKITTQQELQKDFEFDNKMDLIRENQERDITIQTLLKQEEITFTLQTIRDKVAKGQKLSAYDKELICDIQEYEGQDEGKKKRDYSIYTESCAYCGGEVKTYGVGEDGWCIECIKCDTLFDED